MSFSEKIAGLMARPHQDAVPRDDVPWYLKYSARILGIVGAFFCIILGLYNCTGVITINAASVASGILMMAIGFFVMAVEAPCCCMFVDFVQKLAEKADQRPYWNRAALYVGLSIIPLIIYFGLATIFACGLIFGTGVLYGMMSLGKKATAEEMRNAAVQSGIAGTGSTPNIASNDRASIVNNAQPFSFTGAVATDSNV
uniref:Calcium channel flower n=1 Tax=Tabanus bromius TaxID=304241 RepID=A0A0K8TQQ4_TABBR